MSSQQGLIDLAGLQEATARQPALVQQKVKTMCTRLHVGKFIDSELIGFVAIGATFRGVSRSICERT